MALYGLSLTLMASPRLPCEKAKIGNSTHIKIDASILVVFIVYALIILVSFDLLANKSIPRFRNALQFRKDSPRRCKTMSRRTRRPSSCLMANRPQKQTNTGEIAPRGGAIDHSRRSRYNPAIIWAMPRVSILFSFALCFVLFGSCERQRHSKLNASKGRPILSAE